MTQRLDRSVVGICKSKLLEAKQEMMNRAETNRAFLITDGGGGDEADLSEKQSSEERALSLQERLRAQLLEIEYALMRINRGEYGLCEETGEPIEVERLLAIPWTRLSIEGAEMREAVGKRYAK